MAQNTDHVLLVYFALLIVGGQMLMPLLLFTAVFSRSISRHPLWYSFCGSWIPYSLSYTFLLYTGHMSTFYAPHILCLLQAGMIYGAASMGSVALFVYVVQIYVSLTATPTTRNWLDRWSRVYLPVMICLPYLVYLVVAAIVIITFHREPQRLLRLRFYCGGNGVTSYFSSAIAAICTISSLVLEVLTLATVYRNWTAFRNMWARGRLTSDLSILIRTGLLVLGSFISLAASAAFLASYVAITPHMVLAVLPLMAFLGYGTHTELMRIWFCYRGRRRQTASGSSNAPLSVKDGTSFSTRAS